MKRRFLLKILQTAAVLASIAGALVKPALAQPSLPMMHSVQVYGQTIRYFETGSGPDLVLVHGLGSSARFDWGAVIPALSQHYHVIAMDQLGFGTSDKPLIAYGVQTWVDMLHGFLVARHITDFTLVGESLGGWIAADYTIEAERDHKMPVPQKLVLTDAAGHRSILNGHGVPAFGSALSIDGVRTGLAYLFHDHSLITDDFVQKAFITRLAEGNQYTVDSFWKNINAPTTFVDGRLDAIKIPTLVIWGKDDQLLPVADGRDYAAHIKGARLALIDNSAHGPAIERPDAYLAVIEPFLSGQN